MRTTTSAFLTLATLAIAGCQFVAGTENLVETPSTAGAGGASQGGGGTSLGGAGAGGGQGGTSQGGGGTGQGGGGQGGSSQGGAGAGNGQGGTNQGGGGVGGYIDAGDSGLPDVSQPDASDAKPDTADGSDSSVADTGPDGKLSLGASCNQNAQCQSNRCVDFVCCNSACSGPCEQCNIAGKLGTCSMPVYDDPSCGTVVCTPNPPDVCKEYSEYGNCKSLGVCKTAADCTFTAKPRVACDPSVPEKICDSTGACVVPNIPCGSAARTCPATNWCDNNASPDSTCDSSLMGLYNAKCATTSDCPVGKVCCQIAQRGGLEIDCFDTCGPSSSGVDYYISCLTNSDCPTGSCTGTSLMPFYKYCQ